MRNRPAERGRRTAFGRVADNAVSLFALQGLTYAVSFITFPYLVRTLGTSNFGSVSFVNAVMAQLSLLTGFGFGSSATRMVAIQGKNNISQLNVIFSAVTGVKLVLLAVSLAICLAITLCFARFRGEGALFAVAFVQVIGGVLFPDWLFQGLERMRLIAVTSVLARLFSAASVFVFVRRSSDSMQALACQSAGALLQGLIALWIVFFVFKIRLHRPSVAGMWEHAKDSFHPFMSSALGNLLGGSSVLFLGLFKDMNTVGTYAAIERIARAEVLAMIPMSRAAYPHMSQRFHEGMQAGNRAMVKLSASVLGATLLFVGAVAVFSRNILRLLYGNRLMEQAHLFSSFSVWAFLSVLNGLLGLHYLIASGHAKQFAKSVFWSAMVTVSLFGVLINPLGGWGALGAVVAGELVQTAIIVFAIVSINRRAPADSVTIPSVEAAG